MNDLFTERTDLARDFRVDRELVLDNGNKYHVVCKDPHGHWFVHMDRGQVPEKLKGAYTSFEMAKRAVEIYLSSLPPSTSKTIESINI